MTDFAVGGAIADNLDATRSLAEKMPWVILVVIAMTFTFMLVVYRSLLVAGTTVLLNIASTLASFGLLTLIFQETWAERLLGFASNGHLVSWVPLMLFVVLSGLSLDYHVLVVNRIRENTQPRAASRIRRPRGHREDRARGDLGSGGHDRGVHRLRDALVH